MDRFCQTRAKNNKKPFDTEKKLIKYDKYQNTRDITYPKKHFIINSKIIRSNKQDQS